EPRPRPGTQLGRLQRKEQRPVCAVFLEERLARESAHGAVGTVDATGPFPWSWRTAALDDRPWQRHHLLTCRVRLGGGAGISAAVLLRRAVPVSMRFSCRLL